MTRYIVNQNFTEIISYTVIFILNLNASFEIKSNIVKKIIEYRHKKVVPSAVKQPN